MAPKSTSVILRNLRTAMRNSKYVTDALDAYIVPMEDAHQSEYICDADKRVQFVSGFSGSRALVAVGSKAAALWTDGRYFVQAPTEMDDNWTLMKEGAKDTPTLSKWLHKILPNGGRVGVDPYLYSQAQYSTLHKELKQHAITLESVADNLVDIVWGAQKPPEPSNPLIILPVELSGKCWESKIGEIREEMKENDAALLVLSALDEIAWTFNLRGSDIDYNPVFFSYAIIGEDFVSLFLSAAKITPAIKTHLNATTNGSTDHSNGVKSSDDSVAVHLLPYSSVRDYLDKYIKELSKDNSKVWLPKSTNQAIGSIVPEERRLSKMSPVQMLKAVKNSVELAGMRNAHLKDAVSHCEFLLWLETEMAKGSELTELSVADKFALFRREQTDFVSESFTTISASGPNAAQCHYKATRESNATLKKDEIYLVDSGAQYR